MKIKEQIEQCNQKLQEVEKLTKKAVLKTEEHYLETRELKKAVSELITVCKSLTTSVLAIIKQQIGD